MNIHIDLQLGEGLEEKVIDTLPKLKQFEDWMTITLEKANAHLEKPLFSAEISLRIVTTDESCELNSTYRNKPKPTNVLSFKSDLPSFVESDYLGDLVICAEVVANETKEQKKKLMSHWAHMLAHGVLHLLGFDHIDDHDAEIMETLEIKILNQLGIDDPYTNV